MKFDRWFKAQFKRLPMNPAKRGEVAKRLHATEREAYELRQLLAEDTELRAHWRGAMTAWFLTDTYKNGKKP